VIAIRRYSITGAIDAGVRLYRAEFQTLLAISLIVAIPNAITNGFVAALQFLVENASAEQAVVWTFGICGVTLLSIVVGLVLNTIATAAATLVVSAAALGRHLAFGDAIRQSLPLFGTLLAASLLAGLITGVGALLCFIPGIIAALGLLFVGPVVVLERPGPAEALRRSWNLAKDRLGKLLATMFLLGLTIWVVALGIGFVPTLIFPESMVTAVGSSFLSQLAMAFVQPLFYATTVVLYYDARVEKEAFDVEVLSSLTNAPGATEPGSFDVPPATP